MGIGLKLCRSIVESHHGRMQVRNLYNADDVVGCCFSFWIPVVSKLRAEPLQLETGPTSLAEPERAR
jgi:K+-sensing histidine kinase KdpD